MTRVLATFIVIALAAIGAVWLADNPGEVTIVWLGAETTLSVGVALAAICIVLIALFAVFAVARFVLRVPGLVTEGSRARRHERGLTAVSNGLIAVGAGDATASRRFAQDARRYIGDHPLSLLLDAQSAQLSGDRERARAAFQQMTASDGSRLLGLRGLFIEARRAGDDDAARAAAREAVRIAPGAAWANEAVLTDHFAQGDWPAARVSLERAERLRVLDKPTSKRHRAVLLTAEALEIAESDPARGLALAREACDLTPDLTPAVALAARLLGQRGDLKKASRLVEAAWKMSPHPDLAHVYVELRSGDSALDRLHRAQTLAKLAPGDDESALAVAEAAIDARELATARTALAPLAADRPTVRACLLMADLAELDGEDQGATRYWLARAARAPADRVWLADGVASERWLPVSPVTGRLDAFVWAAPPDRPLQGGEPPPPPAGEPRAAAPLVIAAPQPHAAPSAATSEPATEPSADADASPTSPPATPATAMAEPATGSLAPARPGGRPTPVIFPVAHAPDDPGAAEQAPARRWRVFNG